ncbi:MAG: hypothetical protein C4K60_16670 [Ideonella sp. MAG2]|nr:MAG: hypothetical protein C4K60_16670 [Ideonella sp. MAG2]
MLAHAQAAGFDFVALGDTAYRGAADDPAYFALITRINKAQPAFTIHVGDVWGGEACLEPDHQRILDAFARYEHPVIYTPGDNEWTDCLDPALIAAWERIEAGKAQAGDQQMLDKFQSLQGRLTHPGRWALESLSRIRRMAFATPQSLGQNRLALERQSEVSAKFGEMVENARWRRDGVLFATVHVVGSMNGLSNSSPEAAAEALRRNQANVEWIQATFDEANTTQSKAIVLAMHGSFFDREPGRGQTSGRAVRGGRYGAYAHVARALQDMSANFGKPVLLIHGDDHDFMVDRPFLNPGKEGEKPG